MARWWIATKPAIGLLLTASFLSLFSAQGFANECKAFGASYLSSRWHWHYPRETPDVRNGARRLICENGRKGFLYTRDDIPGRYFATNEAYVQQTPVLPSPCSAVTEFCQ